MRVKSGSGSSGSRRGGRSPRGSRSGPGLWVGVAVIVLSGCAGIAAEPNATPRVAGTAPSPGAVTIVTPAPSSRKSPAAPSPAATPEIDTRTLPPAGRLGTAALESALAPVRDRFGDGLAVAWGPVGDPTQVRAVGATRDLEAWSTIKVPIALAVEEQTDGAPSAEQDRQLALALIVSDNDATTELWNSLSDPVAQVRQLLRDAGDDQTEPNRDSDGNAVAFGLTAWRPADSARFATMLPCASHGEQVLVWLGRITPEHQWGLGTVADARFKGGWGPSPHGYLARQIGIVPRLDGSWVGVAVLAQPDAGTHEAATAAIDEAITVLVSLLGADDGGRCPTA